MTTSASTAPPISSREDIWLLPIRPQTFSEAAGPETTEEHRHGRPYVRVLSSRASDREVFFPGAPDREVFFPGALDRGVFSPDACYRVDLREFSGDTVNREITFLRYWESSGSVIFVDFGERTSEFPEEQQEVVERLRRNSRPISRVPGSGVRGRGSGERETTASSIAGKEESSRKEDNSGQGKDGPAGAIAQGWNGR